MPLKLRGHCPNSSHSWSRGEGRTPLKYIMSVLLLIFEYFIEEKVWLLGQSLGFDFQCA